MITHNLNVSDNGQPLCWLRTAAGINLNLNQRLWRPRWTTDSEATSTMGNHINPFMVPNIVGTISITSQRNNFSFSSAFIFAQKHFLKNVNVGTTFLCQNGWKGEKWCLYVKRGIVIKCFHRRSFVRSVLIYFGRSATVFVETKRKLTFFVIVIIFWSWFLRKKPSKRHFFTENLNWIVRSSHLWQISSAEPRFNTKRVENPQRKTHWFSNTTCKDWS